MSPTRLPAQHRGFSLMEVAVAMSVTTIILIGLLTVVDSTQRITRKGLSLAEAQQSADFGLQELTNNLRKTGSGVGRTAAIARQVSTATATYIATWHNYDPTVILPATGIWNNNNGGRVFFPVPGTDGITVRYTDGSPSVHLCGSNSGGGLATWLPSYPYYPTGYPIVGQVYELFPTQPVNCGGTLYDSVTITIQSNPNNNTNCGPPPQQTVCATNDTAVCAPFLNIPPLIPPPPVASCNHYLLNMNPGGCGTFCSMAPIAFTTSTPVSYWISTEDGTGTIYSAAGVVRTGGRPVLVSLQGITGTPRIVTTDVEDLQFTYLFDSTQPSAGVAPANGQLAQIPTTSSNALPIATLWRNQMAAVRALQIGLVVRTSATDPIYKNPAYCRSARFTANIRPLFSRPANGTRAAATAAADLDWCDGMRRQVVRQTIFLPNMISSPS